MSYSVIAIPKFERELKRLSKKFPSIKSDYIALVNELKKDGQRGTPLGNHCYKIRMAIASKSKGKSGGARVITYVKVTESSVYLLTIYDKSEQDNISNKELLKLLEQIPA